MGRDVARFRAAEADLWASVDVTPNEQWVRLAGGENVRVQVAGDGPPVLFLHGGSSSGVNWAPLVAGLPGFRCLVVDRPGCGLSDPVAGGAKLSDLSEIERFADRLVADVLDGLELDRAHVVATSLGGYSAIRGAAAHPGRFARIVEVTWPMGAPIRYVPMSMRVAAVPGLGMLMTKVPPTRFAVRAIVKQIGLGRALESGRVSDEMIDWFLALLRDTDTVANEIRANPDLVTPVRGINPRILLPDELLGRVESPILFVWGGEDPMGGEDVARPFATKFPDASLELLDLAGHAPWIDDPDRCASLISEFLAPDDEYGGA